MPPKLASAVAQGDAGRLAESAYEHDLETSDTYGNDLGTSDEEGLTSVMLGPNRVLSYSLHLLTHESKANTVDDYFPEIPSITVGASAQKN